MIVQFNTDNNVSGRDEVTAPFIASISEELSRFSSRISRVEVHLSDENGKKKGIDDKRCMMEARIEGMQPIAVTNYADTHQQAVDGAIDKLTASLETILGRLSKH